MTLAALLLAVGARAAEPSVGAGASATAGSEGYRSVAVFADADWTRGGVDPYVWGNGLVSRDSRRFSAVGGAAKSAEDWRLNAGAGFSVGTLVDTGESLGALLLEAGAERKLGAAAAGAGYGLSVGRLGGPAAAPAEDRRRRRTALDRGASRGRKARGEDVETETYNELSGFARFPVSKARLTLRGALGSPSYGERVVSETASLRAPAGESLWLTAALTLEQSDRNRAYVSAGFYWLFD
jgi:hypothetical protein